MLDWHPLVLSLQVATLATLLALIAGVALGWLFARHRFPGSSVLEAVCMLPLVLPPTVLGYGILVAMGRRSPLGAWLREHFDYTIIFNWHGAVLASALVALPLVLKSAGAAFGSVDRTLEAAARTLRQSRWSVFVRVTLPLAWPGILAGTLLAFARAMGEFGASLMVAGSIPQQTQTLSMAIYDAVQAGRNDEALLLVGITSLLSIAILVASNRFFSLR
ncbi:molybdate ABC transporter permease subunit [Piscinibacter sp. XHJ-5]|uniref:molybdate ABC transporter permease subunit n=1 Tax=Piscinibacter sp. XHJ-5 TaxID=3037797 RepID=UPI0024530F85|nr:molybdate ABC transporter permease subunit [Piscinibacter sp. XHJ-5]